MKRTAPQPSVWTWEAVPGEDERTWQGSTPGEAFIQPRVTWDRWRWLAFVLVWEDGQWLVHQAGSWNDLIGAQAAASREAWEMIQVRRLMEQAAPLPEHVWDCDLPPAGGC